MLTAEFNNMQKLSELCLALRKQASVISPDNFDISLEEQILSCARGFVSMKENHEFHNQASCHQILISDCSFHVAPVGTEGQVGDQRHVELYYAFHLRAD
jgi:hypothetical protein